MTMIPGHKADKLRVEEAIQAAMGCAPNSTPRAGEFESIANVVLPCISVIIPALNEQEMIGKCLDCLEQTEFPRSLFEVIVVDNGSTDRTMEIGRSYSSRLNIMVLQKANVNISALRNFGAAEAKGKILAFLDADCLVPRDWLRCALQQLQSEDTGIVGGNIFIPPDSRWVARAWYGVGYAPKSGEVSYVPSGNLLVRRSRFLQVGGFNENLKTSEDFDLCVRARTAGLPIRAVAEMAVVHLRTPQTLGAFYRRERWHGTHVVKALRGNLHEMANFRAVAFALYILVCCLGVVAGLGLGLVFQQYTLFAAASFGIIVAPLACSIRKLRTIRGGLFWMTLLPLTVLHLVYGVARARALVNVEWLGV
jgi:cellulose synthase/poly-beta-1,6-N-acetylglucosamine synthase-like glycosyltransferase